MNTANLTFTSHLTQRMTAAKVIETSVNNNTNSLSRDSTNLDDLNLQTCIVIVVSLCYRIIPAGFNHRSCIFNKKSKGKYENIPMVFINGLLRGGLIIV